MEEIISLLLTQQAKLVKYCPGFFDGKDPVAWAVDLCKKNADKGLKLEAMQSAFARRASQGEKVLFFDASKPQAVDGILNGISQAYAGHANLEVIHIDSVDDKCRFEPARQLYRELFQATLNRLHPLGHYVKATLWLSASKHVYQAHVDLADGFLFQFAGKKHVKVWPLPDDCYGDVIYDTSNLVYRQSRPYEEFELSAGDVLYIPAGAAHEVTVDEGYTSVSMSFHLGCPYPLMALCNDLNKKYTGKNFALQEKHMGTDKVFITFFNAGYEQAGCGSEAAKLSPALREELCKVIECDSSDAELAECIETWWSDKLENPAYRGPYFW